MDQATFYSPANETGNFQSKYNMYSISTIMGMLAGKGSITIIG